MKTLIKVDLNATPESQDYLHNRWHPDLPMVAYVKPGDEFRVECIDWTGGQIKNDDDAKDIEVVDLSKVHYLSGPIGVEGAEPGDLLVVDIPHVDGVVIIFDLAPGPVDALHPEFIARLDVGHHRQVRMPAVVEIVL